MALSLQGFSGFSQERIDLGGGTEAVLEGGASPAGDNQWSLKKGAKLEVKSTPEGWRQTVEAFADDAQVEIGQAGVLRAEGIFALETHTADGSLYRVPGKITATRMRVQPEPEDSFVYQLHSETVPQSGRWVVWSQGFFRLQGTTSAEVVHPPDEDNPELLVSISGEVEGTRLTSDLKTVAVLEGRSADFWPEAYRSISKKEQALREVEIAPDRVGAAAYRSFISESLQGLRKLREGYQKLQNRQYTEEVIRRMLRKSAAIPRLELASVNLVCGDSAFSLRPFESWRDTGRVVAHVAYLTNADQEGTSPRFQFVLEDRSGVVGKDTRLVVGDGDAYIESRISRGGEWSMRTPHQFDFLAEVLFSPQNEKVRLEMELDVTGYLLRKAIQVVGQLHMGEIEVTENSLVVHYRPEAPSERVASDFSGFVGIRRVLLFADRSRLLRPYKPEEIDQETWDFMDAAMDRFAEAIHRARIDQIDDLRLELSKVSGDDWKLSAQAAGEAGRTASADYQAPLPENPVAPLWERIQNSRSAGDWLGIDLGFYGF